MMFYVLKMMKYLVVISGIVYLVKLEKRDKNSHLCGILSQKLSK